MIISDLSYDETNHYQELSAKVSPQTSQEGDFRVWFRIPPEQGHLALSGEPFLAGFLIPCMYAGENLHIEASISESLLKNLDSIQNLITTWYPQFQKISVTCTETSQSLAEIKQDNLGQGSCFSGGVDSWYSLLKHQETISHLILVRGFDIKTEDEDEKLWQMTRQNAEMIAQSFEKKLITITTNLRTQTDLQWLFHPKWAKIKYIWGKHYQGNFWGKCLHGSCLAAIGLLLQQNISEFIIPSTHSYPHLRPWGSHPLLDPLWSTASLSVIHDGCEVDRFEKIKYKVSHSDLALKTIKVCYKNPLNQYNCCECEKCLRTMMQLRLCGKLDQAIAFPKPLNFNKVKKLVSDPLKFHYYRKIMEEAEIIGDIELVNTSKILLGEKFSLYRFYKQKIEPKIEPLLTQIRRLNLKLNKILNNMKRP